MPPELHITGCVVHARPEALGTVRRAIASIAGAEIHAASRDGKLVVTLETANEHGVVERLAAMRDLRGVLSAALVFHRVEALPEPEGA